MKLLPIRKEKIWGEEIWTLSGLPNNDTRIVNGIFAGIGLFDLFCDFAEFILGSHCIDNNGFFPLLIKYINCQDDLSVQVHPDDFYAQLLEKDGNGKTECWYILDAEPDSHVIYGHHYMTPELFKKRVLAGQLEAYLNRIKVTGGDLIYVPAGTIHSLGKGIRLIEIQQSSDLTYRIFDWNRTDGKGNQRELHLDKAMQVINFKEPVNQEKRFFQFARDTLFTTPFFSVERIEVHGNSHYFTRGQFSILTIIEGEGVIFGNGEEVKCTKGESLLIPGCLTSYCVMGEEIHILRTSY